MCGTEFFLTYKRYRGIIFEALYFSLVYSKIQIAYLQFISYEKPNYHNVNQCTFSGLFP
jgi:hypothetical protein